jgi:hypothetical protein
MQQYGFSTITVTGLALDTSRVRRQPMPPKQTAEKGAQPMSANLGQDPSAVGGRPIPAEIGST